MIGGYAGKFLEVNLSTQRLTETQFSEELLYQYIGGRGLATKILWDRLGDRWETVDPLGPENLLLMLTGPLTGYFSGARICISGKSPQSNGIIGSTLSGEFPIELKCSGWDGVIVSGKSEEPIYLFIDNEHIEIRDATHIWGLDGKQTLRTLTKEVRADLDKKYERYGLQKEPSTLYIGPAGENLVRVSAVIHKWSHAAGYGGYGAVMGSKNLKAVVAKGTGPLPSVAKPQEVQALIQETDELSYQKESIRRWGTGYHGYVAGASLSCEPVRNWQEEWHDESTMGGDQFDFRHWVKRYWSDYGCLVSCLKLATIRTSPYKGAITDNPDYEMEAYLGPNLAIFNSREVIHLTSLIEDLGYSGINGGNVMAFAAELFQRGILTEDDLGGLQLEWGNVDAFGELAKKIAFREGQFFDILAEGTYRAALQISKIKGIDVLPYAIHVKGVEVGAHGIRSGRDWTNEISYACSVQGGDHTATVVDAYDDMSQVFRDSSIYCNGIDWETSSGDLPWRFLHALTNWEITEKEWKTTLSHRIIHIQRAVELIGGPDITWNPRYDDDNPPRFYEPLPSGPDEGVTANKEEFQKRKKEYYSIIGWDSLGIPKSDVLIKLGLVDVDQKLKKVRSRYA